VQMRQGQSMRRAGREPSPGMALLAREGVVGGGSGGSSMVDAVRLLLGPAPGLCLGSGEYMPCPNAKFIPASRPTCHAHHPGSTPVPD
jgi:hypothetical protein